MIMERKVFLLLDRSGSMSSFEKPVVAGINAFIDKLKGDRGSAGARFILTTFDSQGFDAIRRGAVADVSPLEPSEFSPRALTPLHDAVAHGIETLNTPAPAKAMLVIMTDGLENASKKYADPAAVRKIVDAFQKGGGIVIYLGTHIDAWKQAEEIGVPRERAMNFHAGEKETVRTGMFGRLRRTVSSNPVATALVAAAGLGLVYWALRPGDAAASALAFTDQDRNDAMGVDGVSQTWQDAATADVDSFDEPFDSIFDLPSEVANAEGNLPDGFDPALGSLNEDGEQPGSADVDVLSADQFDSMQSGGSDGDAGDRDEDRGSGSDAPDEPAAPASSGWGGFSSSTDDSPSSSRDDDSSSGGGGDFLSSVADAVSGSFGGGDSGSSSSD
jgi:hypothetical protein